MSKFIRFRRKKSRSKRPRLKHKRSWLGLVLISLGLLLLGLRFSLVDWPWSVVNMLILSDDYAYFGSLAQDGEVLTLVKAPSRLKFKAIRGYGELPLRSLPKLAKQEELEDEVEFVLESVELSLSAPVQIALILPSDQDLGKLGWQDIWPLLRSRTNIGVREKYSLLYQLLSLNRSQLRLTEVETDSFAQLDQYLTGLFSYPEILDQGLNWSVINKSGSSQAGQFVEDWLSKAGVNVVRYQDEDPKVISSVLTVNDTELMEASSVKLVLTSFAGLVELKVDQQQSNSIQLVVGESIYSHYFSK